MWPLVGHSPHHIRNIQNFVEHIKVIQLQEGECMTPVMLRSIFTSVTVGPAMSIVKKQTTTGLPTSKQNLYVPPTHHYFAGVLPYKYLFPFQVKYFEQVHGEAKGYPISP